MPSIDFSVTSSRQQLPYPLVANTELTMSISNPLSYTSYAGLESTTDSSGFYTSSFPRSLSGSIISSSGLIDIVQDDYKVLAVVRPGGGSIVYRPSMFISGSGLYMTGTGAGEKYYYNFTVNTANTSAGSTGGGTFRFPLVAAGAFTASVDWGDGIVNTISSSAQTEVTHVYAATGSYLIRVIGLLPGWRFNNTGDRLKMTNIGSWGDFVATATGSFWGASNMIVFSPDTARVSASSFQNIFRDCIQFNGYLNDWNVAGVTNFQSAFNGCTSYNQPMNKWNMSSANNLSFMFSVSSPANGVFNQDIGMWDVSNVTTLNAMFQNQWSFNQDLSRWNTSNVTIFSNVFARCPSFNKPLNTWDVSKATSIASVLGSHPTVGPGCFNQPLDRWDVSKVTNFASAFQIQGAFNQDISMWNVSSSTNFYYMLAGCNEFTGAIGNWDTANVTTMEGMFFGSGKFNSDISKWNTAKVTNMAFMFSQYWELIQVTPIPTVKYGMTFNQPLATNGSSWNVSSVRTFEGMFSQNAYFNQNISNWNVSSAVTMSGMFFSASAFNQNIGSWNVSSSVLMYAMFYGATSFDQNLGSWDVRNVIGMNAMFEGVTLSTANYDALLIGWNSLPSLRPNVNFSGGNSKYSPAASASRANMISTYGWTITDGGPA